MLFFFFLIIFTSYDYFAGEWIYFSYHHSISTSVRIILRWILIISISSLNYIAFSLLLLLLSRFSRVRLCAIPQTAAHQAPQALGFSRQEHWSGCHFLLQCMKVKSESEVAQSCPTLHDPMDCGLPGSSVHGIFQARVLEWGAIAFSSHYSIHN